MVAIEKEVVMKKLGFYTLTAVAVLMLQACSTVTSNQTAAGVEVDEKRASRAQFELVFVTEKELPHDIEHTVMGEVKAKARKGYDSAESLHKLLADEARNLGANAIINTHGGRSLTAFSWAAPYAAGTAVYVKDTEALKALVGPNGKML